MLAYVVHRKPFVLGRLHALARRAAANYALHLRIFGQLFEAGTRWRR